MGTYHKWTEKENKAIVAEDRPDDKTLSLELGISVDKIQQQRFHLKNPDKQKMYNKKLKKYHKKYNLEHPGKIKKYKRKYYNQASNRDNHYQPWTIREVNVIIAEDRPSDIELSEKLGRSINAIQRMRNKMKNKKSKTKEGNN